MGKAYVVTSGKGGTGKTSVTAGVASCLAALGRRVICVDADMGLRNLDIALGLIDRTALDLIDVLEGRADCLSAAVQHPVISGLALISAPAVTPEALPPLSTMKAFIGGLKARCDYLFIDSPAGLGECFSLAACGADAAIVVSTPDAASLRDARRAAEALCGMGIEDTGLVLNRIRQKLITRKLAANVDDAMDRIGMRLLGVVPEDEQVITCANRGIPLILCESKGAARACLNIAKRLDGKPVPIMRLR